MSNYNTNEDIAKDASKIPAKIGKKAGKNAANKAVKAVLKALKKALLAVLKILLPYLLIIGGILLIIVIAYYILFEFTGTEKQYTKEYENDYIYTEDNVMLTTNQGVNIQNRTIQDFYRYFSGQSYWKIINNDTSTLLSPDDEKAIDSNGNKIEDYYKREDTFKLNSNFLFALDDFLYNGNWKYPEQMIKPVNFDEDELSLKQLADEEGFVVVESDEEDTETGEKTGNKILSVRDYGLATILKYSEEKEWKRTVKIKGTYIAQDVWDEKTKSVVTNDVSIDFEEDLDGYPEYIYLIDKSISFTGDIKYEYEYRDKEIGDLLPGVTEKVNEPKLEYIYKYHKYQNCKDVQMSTGRIEKKCEMFCKIVGTDDDGKTIESCKDYIDIPLKMYRSPDSKIVESLPVVSNTIVNDGGDKYLKDYLYNFETYIPKDTINDFEFKDRIDYDSYVFDYEDFLIDDYGFDLGSALEDSDKRKKYEKSLQYMDLIKTYSEEFGVDPYIILAIMAQESGGNEYINSDGLMQITHAPDESGYITITAKNIYDEYETFSITKNDKNDADKSIKYGVMFFKNLLDEMDGDPYKAIQAYNFGTGTMSNIKNSNPDAWENFGWLIYREKARYSMKEGTKSASYGCMPFPEGEVTIGSNWGDSCYLENVLQYYAGNNMEEVDLANKDNFILAGFKKAGKLFMNFIKERNEDELIPKVDYVGHAKYDKKDDILKTTFALDNSTLFSDSESDTGELNFWDEGFMTSMASIGMNLQDILDIAPNADGYLPPIILGENGATITSYFGMRYHPIDKINKFHGGIDIGATQGTPVYAIADGKVVMARYNGGAGNEVKIDHGNGVVSRYLHLYQFAVKEGDEVRQGDGVGTVGTTGKSTGPHLHFEFIKDGQKLDPLGIITGE